MKKKKKKIEKKESYDINEFLVSIGTIIDEYDKIITNENTNNYFNNNNWYKKKQKGKNNNKQLSVIKTLKMRKILEKSINKFQLNTIAVHVELFTFKLDILTENLMKILINHHFILY